MNGHAKTLTSVPIVSSHTKLYISKSIYHQKYRDLPHAHYDCLPRDQRGSSSTYRVTSEDHPVVLELARRFNERVSLAVKRISQKVSIETRLIDIC